MSQYDNYCGKCGNGLEQGEVFCGSCGTRVEESGQDPVTTSVVSSHTEEQPGPSGDSEKPAVTVKKQTGSGTSSPAFISGTVLIVVDSVILIVVIMTVVMGNPLYIMVSTIIFVIIGIIGFALIKSSDRKGKVSP
jgi:hypothetical protein